jgi:hypothetical protein
MKTLGLILLLVGFFTTLFTGYKVAQQQAKAGTVVVNNKARSPIQWGPATGSILVVAGVVIVVAGRSRQRGY